MRRLSVTVVLASSLALALTGVAQADVTLGTTAPDLGASAQLCASDLVIAEMGSDPTTPFTVPGPGTITQWQTNVSVDTPGSPLVLVVLKPGTNSTVVGVDGRTIPGSAPPGNIATYAVAPPIAVSGGETLGLYSSTPSAVNCRFRGGSTSMTDQTFGLTATSAPAPGQSLPSIGTSPPGEVMNVAATFVPTPPSVPANTGQRTAALKKCRKKHSAKARKRCRKKANLLPL